MMDLSNHIKVQLELPDEAPAATENVWAEKVEDGYRIDNIPWFSTEVTLGDVVEVEENDEGMQTVSRVVRKGSSGSFVLSFEKEMAEETILETMRMLREDTGADTERATREMWSVVVPADRDALAVEAKLSAEHRGGRLHFLRLT